MEENPFPSLRISDFSILNTANGRSECSKCGRSRKFYCYTCFVPVQSLINHIPKVKLPIKIDIIKHPSECDGKSTSPHAAVLAPDDVTLYEYPCIPDYNPQTTILIFPGPSAVSLNSLVLNRDRDIPEISLITDGCDSKLERNIDSANDGKSKTHKDKILETLDSEQGTDVKYDGHILSTENLVKIGTKRCHESNEISEGHKSQIGESGLKQPKLLHIPIFDKVIFIDSTWNQTSTIANDERLKDITRVELKSRKTKFWRNHDGNPEEYLSTIEALYYFVCDYHNLCLPSEYDGQYDNLLFFFCFMYDKIRQSNHGGKHLKAYKKRQKTS
ncbi:hypothetical protein SNE40_001148 [Patella caerulea]|uniref:tRNA-uridine aminocarboxypropyltransferase 1 n=1 Tax=Patella caerulea TaxID=87958 RepID=A0AAN8Q7U5_PATCE